MSRAMIEEAVEEVYENILYKTRNWRASTSVRSSLKSAVDLGNVASSQA